MIKTQNEKTLEYLIKHRSATSIELRRATESSYPAARIYDLQRKHGVSIFSKTETYKNKQGKAVTISRYTILTPMKAARSVLKTMQKATA